METYALIVGGVSMLVVVAWVLFNMYKAHLHGCEVNAPLDHARNPGAQASPADKPKTQPVLQASKGNTNDAK